MGEYLGTHMPEIAVSKNCKAEKCKAEVRAKGYCSRHFKKWRRGELPKPRYKICKEENCRKPLHREGYCEPHYGAWSKSRKARAHAAVKAGKAKAAQEVVPPPAEEVKPPENQAPQS